MIYMNHHNLMKSNKTEINEQLNKINIIKVLRQYLKIIMINWKIINLTRNKMIMIM